MHATDTTKLRVIARPVTPGIGATPPARGRGAAGEAPVCYEPLTPEDRMFLLCEGRGTHMHVAATLVFDGAADTARIARWVEAHLHRVPRYRQRLHYAALTGEPVWADDDRFDLSYHVRHVPVPPPGDDAAVKRVAGRLISRPLDRRHPLWKLYVLTGLDGGRFAIVSKLHHCMVDGIAGTDLLMALLSASPGVEQATPPPFVPRPAPGPLRLLADGLWRGARTSLALAGQVRAALAHPGLAGEWLAYGRGMLDTVAAALERTPETPLNRPIGLHRRFDWTVLALDDVQRVRRRLGGTVNDVGLTTVAGALRRFLLARDPDDLPEDVRVMVPVSVRRADEHEALGNRVSAWIATLPVGEPDPRRRHARVCETTAALKASRQHLGGQVLTSAGSTLVAVGLRLVERLRPFNLLVTSVPGPAEPLYLLGARLRFVFPEAPLFPSQGLAVALFGYAGTLCVGVHADCHVVPDTERFVDAVGESFAELVALADAGGATASARRVGAR